MSTFEFHGKTFEVFERLRDQDARIVSLRRVGQSMSLDISIDNLATGDHVSLVSHTNDLRKAFDVYDRSSRLHLLLIIVAFLAAIMLPSGLRAPAMTTIALYFFWKIWDFATSAVASNKIFENEIDSATQKLSQ